MIATVKTAQYLFLVTQALEAGVIENPKIHTCPECDETMDLFDADRSNHVVWAKGWGEEGSKDEDYTILIGCQDYWLIDPSTVGLPKGNWS